MTWQQQVIISTFRWLNLSANRPKTGLAIACVIINVPATVPAIHNESIVAEINIMQLMDRIATGNLTSRPNNESVACPGSDNNRV
ncbi:hypothetical protein [Serratia liquefaciens]|uniref:hypothetical protein n=1 Tax=Serratia liquefaciens TaxID=614 RepID=UPI001F5E2F73|nr:hypothetical protein [Serratia liquefaciens]